MGVEEETGLIVNHGFGWEDPTILASCLADYLPDNIAYAGKRTLFLQNGGLIYPGGTANAEAPDNIERATPECTTPLQLAIYLQANEQLMVDMTENYVQKMSTKNRKPTSARIQRRVVDSDNNRKGCHDNFSDADPFEYENGLKYPVLIGHLATRSFITGAGYVTPSGLRFAQKIDGLTDVVGYGYAGYMIRAVGGGPYNDTTGSRLEVRCNDINISPWAIQMRLGSTALLMASLETPLAQRMYDMAPARDPLELATELNIAPITEHGEIKPSRLTYTAVDFQERLADMYIHELGQYIEVPEEYADIALELKVYCQDYRKVLTSQATLSLLADRSDMAAKFTRILSAPHYSLKQSKARTEAFRDDLLYDYIGIYMEDNGFVRTRYGYGYKQRDRGGFLATPLKSAVANACTNPPKDTRAHLRGSLIKKYHTIGAEWNSVDFEAEICTSVELQDPLQTTIDDSTRQMLEFCAVRK